MSSKPGGNGSPAAWSFVVNTLIQLLPWASVLLGARPSIQERTFAGLGSASMLGGRLPWSRITSTFNENKAAKAWLPGRRRSWPVTLVSVTLLVSVLVLADEVMLVTVKVLVAEVSVAELVSVVLVNDAVAEADVSDSVRLLVSVDVGNVKVLVTLLVSVEVVSVKLAVAELVSVMLVSVPVSVANVVLVRVLVDVLSVAVDVIPVDVVPVDVKNSIVGVCGPTTSIRIRREGIVSTLAIDSIMYPLFASAQSASGNTSRAPAIADALVKISNEVAATFAWKPSAPSGKHPPAI
jgi:hypothetical protein